MAMLKCKMCGGDINATDNTYGTCGSCGSTMTLPKASDERKANLFNRANHFRQQKEFDKALHVFEKILNEDNTDAEAHWGLILSKYGIEYVEDPATGKRIPTCNRVQSDSILSDADYLSALRYAPDEYTRSLYEEEAQIISVIQKGLLAISKSEEPYDVFICYKETTDGGSRTVDSTIAWDVYHHLNNSGYRVFFSRVTLEGKLGQQYEPYIFSALNSAKVMLVLGTKQEYFNAVWVKNEWSRFLALTKTDRSRLIIPCYKEMNAYDIPDELASFQAQDMSKIGSLQDIIHGIKKVLDASKASETTTSSGHGTTSSAPGVDSLMKRGWLFLEDSDWRQADEYFGKVLDIDPEHAPAYIGKLFAELNFRSNADLENHLKPLDNMPNYQKALRFAEPNYRVEIEGYNQVIQKNIQREQERIVEEERQKQEYLLQKKELVKKRSKQLIKHCSISGSSRHFVALKADGTVVATGDNDYSQCNIQQWSSIVAVATGGQHTVGLKADGTVVAVGNNDYGQCNISDWHSIIAVSACDGRTAGLKSDGTVIIVGRYDYFKGKNYSHKQYDTEGWSSIVAISSEHCATVGIKSDGTIIAAGPGYTTRDIYNVSSWQNIVGVSIGLGPYTVGLKANGCVVTDGYNSYGACNVSSWNNIVAVATGDEHTVGLKADGTVVAAGKNNCGQCNTSNFRDIVAIYAYFNYTVGLKLDGTVVMAGQSNGNFNISDWRDIGLVLNDVKWEREEEKRQHAIKQSRTEEQERVKWSNHWASQGLCRRCGGQISGMFGKKCKSCGKSA